ncbi:MAG: LPS export ABC transporter periplasmic protein LptC [Candidatus Eisenbacteria bacterium]|uniref:LPS export ABC transporter periplasmic protein LptC n=1 Tax=Eiseniibacteriota bacterium TaxID=2212470 RepID=A0A956N9T2_UNCEI|nr:LPS export ABC transporter periplasmic protein LptC [Candidatus Eisenbacteria bacterium]MCB9462544.1 LPS export ABC transporter periplasmic protein LptC [Candidatus Eisenbacteria bacterium]
MKHNQLTVWIACILSVFAFACGSEETPVGGPIDGPDRARQIVENAVMRETSVKGLLYVLRADKVLSYEEDEPTELRELTLHFYDGDDSVRSILTSRRGHIDPKSDLLVAEDSVVVVTPEGDRLETEKLEWDPKTERVRTDLPFTLYREVDVVTGVGIEADPDLGSYSVFKELRAVVRDAPDLEEIDDDDGR